MQFVVMKITEMADRMEQSVFGREVSRENLIIVAQTWSVELRRSLEPVMQADFSLHFRPSPAWTDADRFGFVYWMSLHMEAWASASTDSKAEVHRWVKWLRRAMQLTGMFLEHHRQSFFGSMPNSMSIAS